MDYLVQRSIYYTILMEETVENGADAWVFTAGVFNLSDREKCKYGQILANKTLKELGTVEDINMYYNYLDGFCSDEREFGKSRADKAVLEIKTLALHKACELYGDVAVKSNRLRLLSHRYGNDHVGAVLYALRLLYVGGDNFKGLAKDILKKELTDGKNSDAGLALLSLSGDGEKEEITLALGATPDMILRPEVLNALGINAGNTATAGKRLIGF